MKLVKLNYADVHRDGGSYGASFQTDDGLTDCLWLQRSKMPDDEGLHHRWLYEYIGLDRPRDCLPVITGSSDERMILGRLKDFLASHTDEVTSAVERTNLDRLTELTRFIERREPCFASDIAAWRPDVS